MVAWIVPLLLKIHWYEILLWKIDRIVTMSNGTYPCSSGRLYNFWNNDFHLTTNNYWSSTVIHLRQQCQETQALEYRINWKIYMHVVLMECCCIQMESSLWENRNHLNSLLIVVLNCHSMLIHRCRSRYEADLAVSVVSFISSSSE